MDKFAVDIEKVLDEFEYNEGIVLTMTALNCKKSTLSSPDILNLCIR